MESPGPDVRLPPHQESIRASAVHPTGAFTPFARSAIEQSVPSRFAQQVRRHRERVAVKAGTRTLSYAELDRAANRVAQTLLAQAAGDDAPVALAFAPGPAVVAAILGVLKAGRIYVPLDVAFPLARLAYMLDDSRARVVVTDDAHLLLARTLAEDRRQIVNVDALATEIPPEDPGLTLSPDAPAWIIYTSGSTGLPKGVVHSHRTILHTTMNNTNERHLCSEDRIGACGSLSVFGGSTSIFIAVLNGAVVCLLDLHREGLSSVPAWLAREAITFCAMTPTLFRQVGGGLTGGERFPALRVLFLTGEAAERRDVELYQAHCSPTSIMINSYGVTETSGGIRRYFVDAHTELSDPSVPAGYPVDDKTTLLLDEAGAEVGPGAIGEIVVRSRYLALAYWRKPHLTRAKFLPDPRGGDERLYFTGDLGRLRADGCLVNLGRRDSQVKIRGYRVEIAEVESALLGSGLVQAAAVVAHERAAGEAQLVAYVVPAVRPAPTVEVLRRRLAETLPAHMVPAVYVTLDALPLTPTGKVDRRALPLPRPGRPHLEIPFVAPRTPDEEALLRVWSEVLGLEGIGVDDPFLDLGGDSLLATRIIARIVETFRVELPIQALFDAPTIAQAAAVIARHRRRAGPGGG